MAGMEETFKALGDPVRMRIVQMLAKNGELCVCKIMEEIKMTQPAVSHHLATLKRAELVRARKKGQWVYYSLSRDVLCNVPLAFLRNLVGESAKNEQEQACRKTEC